MAPATVLPGYVHRIRVGEDAARGRRGIGSIRFVQMSNQAFLYIGLTSRRLMSTIVNVPHR